MSVRDTKAALAALGAAAVFASMPGCATRVDPQATGAFVDDAAITSKIRSRMAEDKEVDASGISVATTNGTVVLSGIARTTLERNNAESIATATKGAKLVKNEILLRPVPAASAPG